MLFTRCPECETTFRITEEALQKASGQVRCGRCAHIFNAYRELREAVASEAQDAAQSDQDDGPRRHEEIVLETTAPDDDADLETATTANRLKALNDPATDDDAEKPEWLREDDVEARPSRWRLWAGATLAATLILMVQLIVHFRSELVAQPFVGPLLQSTFRALGASVEPTPDVRQYDLLDWVAVAEPAASGQGNLVIRSRVQNKGPAAQPHPYIYLKLLDRWEETIGSRIFEPKEYLPENSGVPPLMPAGMTTGAVLVLVDPGPDAYGFELDVCVRVADAYRCGADQTFR